MRMDVEGEEEERDTKAVVYGQCELVLVRYSIYRSIAILVNIRFRYYMV